MTSALHAQTARENGAKSRGPVSEQGKAVSSKNAVRHGLSARTFELRDPADRSAFAQIEQELIETYMAVTLVQKRQVTQMAVAMWRQQIVANLEMSLLAAMQAGQATANEGGAGLPSMNSIYRYRARIERDLKAAQAILQDLQAARVKMIEHKLHKAKEFKELSGLSALREELGEEGFGMLRADVTNEPNPHANQPPAQPPTLKREQRRRLAAMNRKQQKHPNAN